MIFSSLTHPTAINRLRASNMQLWWRRKNSQPVSVEQNPDIIFLRSPAIVLNSARCSPYRAFLHFLLILLTNAIHILSREQTLIILTISIGPPSEEPWAYFTGYYFNHNFRGFPCNCTLSGLKPNIQDRKTGTRKLKTTEGSLKIYCKIRGDSEDSKHN